MCGVNETSKCSPRKEANRISTLLNLAEMQERFPLDVEHIMRELIPQFNQDPITDIQTLSNAAFNGALCPNADHSEWLVIITDKMNDGRRRFTLAHELGHYLMHRHEYRGKAECAKTDIEFSCRDREREADEFAAWLLMPADDFRREIAGKTPDLELFNALTKRYGVSLTSVISRWIELTSDWAVMVVSDEDHFTQWAKSSKSALNSGCFFKTRENAIEIPDMALARNFNAFSDTTSCTCPARAWFPKEPGNMELSEFIFDVGYYGYMITLLLLPPALKPWERDDQDN